MKWNYVLVAVLTIAFVFAVCSGESEAASDDSGSCGENVTYAYESSTGTLTISGTGKIADYPSESFTPWNGYREEIKRIVIENGITSVGDRAFSQCSSVTSLTIPGSVTSIGFFSFSELAITSLTIPDSVTTIGEGSFWECCGLKELTIPIGIDAAKNSDQ
ncbi:MAG: leucine-rich repeat domain-containing protein, partial [Candidatus Methanomethylophilaceae archaeon]